MTGSGQLRVLLTAPLLLALLSIRSRSKTAQVLGLNTVQVQRTPRTGSCASQAGAAAPRGWTICRGTLLNSAEVLPPHTKSLTQVLTATGQGEKSDTSPQANTKAGK